jgi:curved DNA-binding protein CbpA
MQRYRIIVAAHEILSDPVKRDAYDKDGLGWHQRSELFAAKSGENQNGQYARYTRQRGSDNSVFRNATWEDWERWYQRNDSNRSRPSTVSHGTFASFLILLSLFAGTAQAVTIGKFSSVVDERAKEANQIRGRFLDGRENETLSQMGSQDARVQNFLIKRDPSGYGLKEEEEETYRRFLSPRGTASGLDALHLESEDS